MKLKVTREGRPNIYLPDKESLKKFIKSRKLKEIHNFIEGGSFIVGADHSVKSVIEDIDKGERIAVFTSDQNMGHSLAIILNNRLECYDIGKIDEKDLEIL